MREGSVLCSGVKGEGRQVAEALLALSISILSCGGVSQTARATALASYALARAALACAAGVHSRLLQQREGAEEGEGRKRGGAKAPLVEGRHRGTHSSFFCQVASAYPYLCSLPPGSIPALTPITWLTAGVSCFPQSDWISISFVNFPFFWWFDAVWWLVVAFRQGPHFPAGFPSALKPTKLKASGAFCF